jgi:hypothetical protein
MREHFSNRTETTLAVAHEHLGRDMTEKKTKPSKRGPSLKPSDGLVLGTAHQDVRKGTKKGTVIRAALKEFEGKPNKTPDGEGLDYYVNRLSKAYSAAAKHIGKTIGVSGGWRKDPTRRPKPPAGAT